MKRALPPATDLALAALLTFPLIFVALSPMLGIGAARHLAPQTGFTASVLVLIYLVTSQLRLTREYDGFWRLLPFVAVVAVFIPFGNDAFASIRAMFLSLAAVALLDIVLSLAGIAPRWWIWFRGLIIAIAVACLLQAQPAP